MLELKEERVRTQGKPEIAHPTALDDEPCVTNGWTQKYVYG